jgi:hypothetical protein
MGEDCGADLLKPGLDFFGGQFSRFSHSPPHFYGWLHFPPRQRVH